MIVQTFSGRPETLTRCGRTHIVVDPSSREALLIDPGADRRVIRAFLSGHGATIRIVGTTRSEAEGRSGLEEAAEVYDARVLGAPVGWPAPGGAVEDRLGGRRIYLERAPDGQAAIVRVPGALFTGLALLAGEIPALPDAARLRARAGWLRRVLDELPLRTRIYPGIGPVTEVGLERSCTQELWG